MSALHSILSHNEPVESYPSRVEEEGMHYRDYSARSKPSPINSVDLPPIASGSNSSYPLQPIRSFDYNSKATLPPLLHSKVQSPSQPPPSKSTPAIPKASTNKCHLCAVTVTPLWRRSPTGETVCNACGELRLNSRRLRVFSGH